MIKKISFSFSYSVNEKNYLNQISPFIGEYWKNPPVSKDTMANLKKSIKKNLKKIQGNVCAYCGLDLEETSEVNIEHIAPKGMRKNMKTPFYPEFMFTAMNLVLACSYCNGFSKKGTIDTVSIYDFDYYQCDFSIVHPYFDDPNLHYDWAINNDKIIIISKSTKGSKSIEIFKLDAEQQTIARAKKLKQLDPNRKLSAKDDELLKSIINYK